MKLGKYRLLENFDAFICDVGRVQVGVGAEFQIEKSPSGATNIYFLNSKNYLPFKAVSTFLDCKREPIDEKQNSIKKKFYVTDGSPIKLERESFIVHTRYENDGYNDKNKYEFSSKDEFLKFADGKKATDRYGNICTISYYEHIEYAYIKGDIDIMALYDKLNKNIGTDENNLDENDR